jgi:hypothetical protein
VFVFGAVYVEATPQSYSNSRLTSTPHASSPAISQSRVPAIRRSVPNLQGFTLEQQDIQELKNCKAGHCEVQLPSEAMEDFQHSINWSAPDVADNADRVALQMALQGLLNYMQGGNTALGAYRDKNHPAAVAESFASLIGQFKALPVERVSAQLSEHEIGQRVVRFLLGEGLTSD